MPEYDNSQAAVIIPQPLPKQLTQACGSSASCQPVACARAIRLLPGGRCLQVAESRVSDLTNRLALAEEKVTALKGERSRLYQQLAESSSASRTQVCENTGS